MHLLHWKCGVISWNAILSNTDNVKYNTSKSHCNAYDKTTTATVMAMKSNSSILRTEENCVCGWVWIWLLFSNTSLSILFLSFCLVYLMVIRFGELHLNLQPISIAPLLHCCCQTHRRTLLRFPRSLSPSFAHCVCILFITRSAISYQNCWHPTVPNVWHAMPLFCSLFFCFIRIFFLHISLGFWANRTQPVSISASKLAPTGRKVNTEKNIWDYKTK